MVWTTPAGNSMLYLTAGIGVGFVIVLAIVLFAFITRRFYSKHASTACDVERIREIEPHKIEDNSSDLSTNLLTDLEKGRLRYDTFPGCSKEVEATLTNSLAAALQSTNSYEKNEVPDYEESVHPPEVVSEEDDDDDKRLDAYCLEDFIADQPSTSGAEYGSLKIAISYFLDQNELLVTVIEGIDLPPQWAMSAVLNVGLLPGRAGAKTSRSWRDVQFDKTFRIAIRPDDIVNTNLRFWFTLDHDTPEAQDSFEHFIATEAVHDLADTDEDIIGPVIYTLRLEPIKQEVSALCDSAILLSPRPEEPAANVPAVLVGLMYIATAGKLVVSVLKARGVSVFNELPDTFVKVTAISPYGDEIAKYKTKLVKQRASPLFDESFVFQVPNGELDYVSITLSVYCLLGVWRRRVLIGWLNLGAKVGSGDCESHWSDMIEAVDDTIARWHSLIEP